MPKKKEPKAKQPTVEDKAFAIVEDELVRTVARCLKRIFAELSEDEIKEGLMALWIGFNTALDTVPKILGPKLMKEAAGVLRKVSTKFKEAQMKIPEKKSVKPVKQKKGTKKEG